MKLDKLLRTAYKTEVKAPHGYEEVVESVVPKKTLHLFFQSLKYATVVTASVVGALVLGVAGIFLIAGTHIDERPQSIKKARFSVYDTNLIMSETFKRKNSISYTAERENEFINPEFKQAVSQFACNSFAEIDKNKNYAYSPLMLYTQLDLISCAASDEETKLQFDNALQSEDTELRATGISTAMRNNFFADDERKSTVQAKNAVFLESKFGANNKFVDDMTKRNAEVYEMDFQNPSDVNKAVEWANMSVNEPGFMNANDLNIKYDSAMLFLSSLYFDNCWSQKFMAEDTKPDNFYAYDGRIVQKDFMNHVAYLGFTDQKTYVSVTDEYANGYSIQYFVPKKIEDNIFDLLPDDFLFKADNHDWKSVSLYLPKMSLTCESDLSDMAKNLGITNPYKERSNHLKDAFSENAFIEYSYLNYTKQKTSVSFDEDGTVVKTLTITLGAAGTDAYNGNGYEIKLNQPFVYCIRDPNGLPLILGSVVDPQA